MKKEITTVKAALAEENDLNAKRHDALLAAITVVAAKLPFPPPFAVPCSLLLLLLPDSLSYSVFFCFSFFCSSTTVLAYACVFVA